MKQERSVPLTPAMEKAVNELKGRISKRFPQASFVVEEGFDPKGIYLVTTVDIADTDEEFVRQHGEEIRTAVPHILPIVDDHHHALVDGEKPAETLAYQTAVLVSGQDPVAKDRRVRIDQLAHAVCIRPGAHGVDVQLVLLR